MLLPGQDVKACIEKMKHRPLGIGGREIVMHKRRNTFRLLRNLAKNLNEVFGTDFIIMQTLYPDNKVEGYTLFRSQQKMTDPPMSATEMAYYLYGIMFVLSGHAFDHQNRPLPPNRANLPLKPA